MAIHTHADNLTFNTKHSHNSTNLEELIMDRNSGQKDHNSQNYRGVHPFIGDLSELMIQVESHMNKYSAPIIIKLFHGRDKYYRQYPGNSDK
jgi:hypothetical protein